MQKKAVVTGGLGFIGSKLIELLIKKKIEEGNSEKQIYEYLKNQYGEWIVYEPEFNKRTFFLWLLPILVFFVGGWLIFKKIKFLKL